MKKLADINLTKSGIFFTLVCTILSTALLSGDSHASGKKSAPPKPADACEEKFDLPADLANNAVPGTAHIAVELPFTELTDLLSKHPLLMMSAAQRMLAIINHFGWTEVTDPVYKTARYTVPRLFMGENLEATGGHYLVNQYVAASRIGTYVAEVAKGQRGSKALALMGPPGTGKTVGEEAISSAAEHMASRDSRFEVFTFRWKNLDKVLADPELGPKLKKYVSGDTLSVTTLKRSPFVLLPPELKKYYAKKYGAEASKMLGFNLGDFYDKFASSTMLADPHSEELISEYLIPYFKKHMRSAGATGALTNAEHMAMLSEFVAIKRKDLSGVHKAPIIRPMEGQVDTNALLGTTNIGARLSGSEGPLGFHLSGDLSRTDGGFAIWDDVLRNDRSVLDFLLGVIQENIAKASESPTLKMDVVTLVSANHSSMKDANKRGDTGALQSRLETLAMNLLLHPVQTAETIVLSIGPKVFKMRKHGETEIKPLNIKEVFTNPDRQGNVLGPDGRYTLYVDVGATEDGTSSQAGLVEISPYSLLLMGTVAVATRIVTDPNTIKEKSKLSGLTDVSQRWFRDPIDRIRVILGEEGIERPEVLAELTALTGPTALNEGDSGMAQRDLEVWFKTALALALRPHAQNTLTPIEVRDALRQVIGSNQFRQNSEMYLTWLNHMERVATELTLPNIVTDVNTIISSDGDKLKSNYYSIANELKALAANDSAEYHTVPGGDQIRINKDRLAQVSKIFQRRFGVPLRPSNFTAFVAQAASVDGEVPMWNMLKVAIQDWLISRQTSDGTYKSYLDFFTGRPVGAQIAREGEAIRESLYKFGYNERSFVQAIRFLYDYANKLDRTVPK